MNEDYLQATVQLFRNVEEGMTCEADMATLEYLLDLLGVAEKVQARVDRLNHEEQICVETDLVVDLIETQC